MPAAIAARVLAADGVVAMSAGPVGQFRSYLPGGVSVPGVRLDDDRVEVNIVAEYGPRLAELGDRLARELTLLLGGRSLTVSVDDVVLPGEATPGTADPYTAESVVEIDDPPAARTDP